LPTAVRIPLGAQAQKNRSTDNVERFLSLIRFENKEKLKELGWIYEKGLLWGSNLLRWYLLIN